MIAWNHRWPSRTVVASLLGACALVTALMAVTPSRELAASLSSMQRYDPLLQRPLKKLIVRCRRNPDDRQALEEMVNYDAEVRQGWARAETQLRSSAAQLAVLGMLLVLVLRALSAVIEKPPDPYKIAGVLRREESSLRARLGLGAAFAVLVATTLAVVASLKPH